MKTKTIRFVVTIWALLFLFTVPVFVMAQETEDEEASGEVKAAEDTNTEENTTEEAIEELKEKVESKVSELAQSSNTTYAGFVQSLKDDVLTLTTENGTLDVALDPELTKFYQIQSNSSSEIDQEDISEDDYVLVSGPKIGDSITGNAVYKDASYLVRSGKIIEVNSDTYYISVQTLEKDIYTIDIENSSKQQLLDIKTLTLESAGFSKLKEGDNIHVVMRSEADESDNRYTAVTTIIIPQEYFIKE